MGPVQTRQAVMRLVHVLDERRVFGAGAVKSLKELVEAAPAADSPSTPAGMPASDPPLSRRAMESSL
jgi:hypothetical protein